jgi:hypothetical protein
MFDLLQVLCYAAGRDQVSAGEDIPGP